MTHITIPRAVVEQALEALEMCRLNGSQYLYGGERDLVFSSITTLRTALAQEQAEPVQEPEPGEYHGWVLREVLFDNGEPVGHREPVQEPVARECSDPMCACRGGPCAECEEGQREREIEDLRFSLDFYQRRCEALQAWQCKMRDPERTIVCDILANGFTLDAAFAGDRYTAPPQRKPLPQLAESQCPYPEGHPSLRDAWLDGWEAAERAHGIGGQDE